MKLKIHRGTKEIGGSCVEVWTKSTRILVDCGMPLVAQDGHQFEIDKYKNLNIAELIKEGILPDVAGLYEKDNGVIDGIILSHAHLDHYGLFDFLKPDIKIYLGQATHKIIELNSLFTPQSITIANPVYFEKEKTFQIGDISITPYWADHSAFDSYSFLIEADGKKIFYSGDFRGHGRKSKVFEWFTHHAPQNVDYLLLEGTSLGRESKPSKSETDIEAELVSLFSEPDKINLVYTSGQNIDRLVSIYRACLKTDKILVVDVYVADILKELSKFAKIPYPSKSFNGLRVIFPYYTSRRLKNSGNEKLLYQFKDYKITKEEISSEAGKVVMVVRPSMQKDLDNIKNIDGGNLVYSMWEGYMEKSSTKEFISYLTKRKFAFHIIHTSGHADVKELEEMADALKPKAIIPIHTFEAGKYKNIFKFPVIELGDGEEAVV
ncbi:MAG: MBL fold metallo-hydrolase [Candidatus Paceibacterota bacterium]|jgi:ribonuclease J